MTTLVESLDAMARLYRGYDAQLAEWLSTGPSDAGADAAAGQDLARLSRLEEDFITRARVLGEAVERERVRIAGSVGSDLALREAAHRTEAGEDGERACNEAAAAIAAVARRRVEVLRRLEAFCSDVRNDRGKIAATRRLGKLYYRNRGKGRRVDGHV